MDVDTANGSDIAAATWRMWGHLSHAAALQARRNGDDPDRTDTLPRTRLRAAARAKQLVDPAGQLQELYDPDSVGKQFYHPAEEINYRALVPVRHGADWLDPPGTHRIQLVSGFEGGRPVLREVLCRTAEELASLAATPEYRRSRLLEATGEWHRGLPDADLFGRAVTAPLREAHSAVGRKLREVSAYDPFVFGEPGDRYSSGGGASVTRDIDQEFIPIYGGPFNKNLYLYAHWEAVAKCFEMKNHSELAKATVDITTDFCLGRGLTWKIRNARARELWEEFWKRNNMEMRVRQLCADLVWQGELVIRKDEPLRGFLRIRSIDPSAIYELVTNPEDIEEVYFAHIQYPTQYQLPMLQLDGRNLNIPLQKYLIYQIPAPELYHIKLNVTAYEKWGRSDYFAALGTLKRFRDWLNATTLKDMLQANLVWDIAIHGDDADVQAFVADSANDQLPPPAGTFVHNDALTLKQLHEDVGGTARLGQGSTGNFLIALYATSQGHPASYYNLSGAGLARATALVQSEPVVKKIATRQQVIRLFLDHIFDEVCARAVRAGRILASELRREDADPEWVFPSTYEEDRGAKFRDLQTGFDRAVISHQTMATTMAQDLGVAEYDYDEEMVRVAADKRNPLFAPPPTLPPVPAGPGQQPPSMVPAGREQITGADATAEFRRRQVDAPTAGTPQVEALRESVRSAVRRRTAKWRPHE